MAATAPGVVLPPEKKGGGFKGFMKAAFPFITTAAAVAGGPAASALLGKLGSALGVNNPNPTMDDLEVAYMNATPEQILAAKAHDDDVKLKFQQAGYDHIEALQAGDNADRNSARDREKTVRDKTPAWIATAVIVGFFGVIGFVLKYGLPHADGREAIILLLGALSTSFGAVVAYYFGSSSGSAAKTELLARAPALPETKPMALSQ